MSYTFRRENTQRTITESEPASEPAPDPAADDDGPISRRTSAIPQQRDEVA